MTRDDDFIGQLEGYLDEFEGVTPLPDAIRDAVRAQLPTTKQIDPFWGLMRYLTMNNTPRYMIAGVAAVAALLIVGLVLLPRTNVGPSPSGSAEPTPIPTGQASAAWASGQPMLQARYLQTATVLPDGRVLVVGGRYNASTASGALDSAEIYDPRLATWTVASNMLSPRAAHSSTLLADGRVLVAGGYDDFTALTTAELYDPSTGTWTATGRMAEGRGYDTATLLSDGRVLVAGGRSNDSSTGHELDSAELYDPSTGRWTATGSMSRGRTFHTAILLTSGQVLVAGAGVDGVRVDRAATAELYDPTTGRWSATGGMTGARAYHTATLLSNGKVLVVGGYDSVARTFQAGGGAALSSAELYDPGTGTWQTTGNMRAPRGWHTATLLLDGTVLVVSGQGGESNGVVEGTSASSSGTGMSSAEIYDPSTGSWTPTANLAGGRELHVAVLLTAGRVLVAGGSTGGAALSSVELFQPGIGR